MSLFTSLYPLAKSATLTLLITVEGDQLRVNVTPRANGDTRGEKTLYPLSILATPEELDRDFAEAVSIYEPSVLSVLDQARAASAASAANGAGTSAKAAPLLAAPTKGKPGRKPKAATTTSDPTNAPTENTSDEPDVDPRQTAIPGLEGEPVDAGAATATPAPETGELENEAQAAADAGGVDIF
ncbi:PRTRC genetic system protein E [Paraburkholderia sp. JPY465]|uniref:PRTRC system protein E n=1 Tax=Paraburkholderia sp. JPY465 TaxID=3042285 RepID=UPI003D1FB6F8